MNYTRTPNPILDQLPDMKKNELKLTMLLVRLTFGYTENGRHREEVRLTFQDMMDEMRVAKGTVNKAVQEVEKRGFFRRGRRSTWHLNPQYSLNLVQKVDQNSSKTEPEEESGIAGMVQKVDQNSSKTEPNKVDNSSKSEPFLFNKERKEKKDKAPAPPNGYWLIPENLKNDEFIRLWGTWLEHTDQAGLRFTEKQAAIHLAELSDAGLPLAINSIKVSLLRGWRNIYITNEPTNGRASPASAEQTEAMSIPHTGKGW